MNDIHFTASGRAGPPPGLHRALAAPILAVALGMALGMAPAWADENCGDDPASAVNHTDHYILGEIGGDAVAMHWHSGLVWKRCVEGRSGAGCESGGQATTGLWHGWAANHLPLSFSGQDAWGVSADTNVNRLASGDWRMAYVKELEVLATGCGGIPMINHTVFPNTPYSYHAWSGSPNAGNTSQAWLMYYGMGNALSNSRLLDLHIRLARGGQPFSPLASPVARQARAGSRIVVGSVTLTPASGNGAAWGGARIQGDGNPEFQINGDGPWLTEAVVTSGDTLTVRMIAGSSGDVRTATLTLRGAQTTGTSDGGGNGGNEFTVPYQSQAVFTTQAIHPVVKRIVIDPNAPSTLHALVSGEGVFASLDGGANWSACAAQPADSDPRTLAVTANQRLYAAGADGVHVSDDDCATWTTCPTQPSGLDIHELLAATNSRLYAGGAGGAHYSDDGCATWTAINTGLPD